MTAVNEPRRVDAHPFRARTAVPLRPYTLLTAHKLTATWGCGAASAAVVSTSDDGARGRHLVTPFLMWAPSTGRQVPPTYSGPPISCG
jgi:hypothetical protein